MPRTETGSKGCVNDKRTQSTENSSGPSVPHRNVAMPVAMGLLQHQVTQESLVTVLRMLQLSPAQNFDETGSLQRSGHGIGFVTWWNFR